MLQEETAQTSGSLGLHDTRRRPRDEVDRPRGAAGRRAFSISGTEVAWRLGASRWLYVRITCLAPKGPSLMTVITGVDAPAVPRRKVGTEHQALRFPRHESSLLSRERSRVPSGRRVRKEVGLSKMGSPKRHAAAIVAAHSDLSTANAMGRFILDGVLPSRHMMGYRLPEPPWAGGGEQNENRGDVSVVWLSTARGCKGDPCLPSSMWGAVLDNARVRPGSWVSRALGEFVS